MKYSPNYNDVAGSYRETVGCNALHELGVALFLFHKSKQIKKNIFMGLLA